MQDFISFVSIKNFKSIKDLGFHAKKVNIFIGKPNVGKSNILEALSIFGLPLSTYGDLDKSIRLKTMRNLFYDNNVNEEIKISINNHSSKGSTALVSGYSNYFELTIGKPDFFSGPSWKDEMIKLYEIINSEKDPFFYSRYKINYAPDGKMASNETDFFEYKNPVRAYKFKNGEKLNSPQSNYLTPQNGQNLVTVLQNSNALFNEIQGFFEEYGFELLIDVDKNEFEIQKRVEKRVYKYPFELMADTLQRIIFYLAAIESNKGASIIFEEPETNSFPPYIRIIAKRIINDEANQFFISTHSPYLLNTMIEDIEYDDINVFVTYFEDYQTKVKLLTKEELREILDDSIDAFFNLDRYTPILK